MFIIPLLPAYFTYLLITLSTSHGRLIAFILLLLCNEVLPISTYCTLLIAIAHAAIRTSLLTPLDTKVGVSNNDMSLLLALNYYGLRFPFMGDAIRQSLYTTEETLFAITGKKLLLPHPIWTRPI